MMDPSPCAQPLSCGELQETKAQRNWGTEGSAHVTQATSPHGEY